MKKKWIVIGLSIVACWGIYKSIKYVMLQEELKQYKFLHENPGSKNYEVVELIPRIQKLKSFEIDTIGKKLLIAGVPYEEWRERDDDAYSFIKTDFEGNILSHLYRGGKILKDGTLINAEEDKGFYCNSVINDDMTLYPLIQLPFSFNSTDYWKEEFQQYNHQDLDKWFKVFKDLYDKAEYVYQEYGEYFLKYRGKWYWMMYPSKEKGFGDREAYKREKAFTAQYPAREPASRFIELTTPVDPFDQYGYDVRVRKYEPVDEQGGSWFNPISYSAGYFYYALVLDKDEFIYIKRYSAYDPRTFIYEVPEKYSGYRGKVLFMMQEPRESDPEAYGGLYVIRPRKKK
ncbi:hypothetical protein CGC58_11450 [Capnocytophaga stomatis]|uniref:Uncharacterized protein n=1 Tax=Capnocytophaga stomatis TaxID=1848904 RepID=A0A250FYU6_9FLAO|nr:hypothetical protein [Capnocytophaga stomatis]ATA90288.1 hypothetical protein CGC58_11440 [Capnocytophaga stomatis]ATA90290.1 hypothetical protein CGC58_11450 [Capnocytophaga stomatis]